METKVCKQFGIEVPIFGFSHCRDVVAAVSAAGGMGVFGAATFAPDELEAELAWLDAHCQGRPYGVNVIMADSRVEGDAEELERMIPQGHRDFVAALDDKLGVPPLRADAPRPPAVFRNMEMRSTHGWARPQLEVIWRHNPKLLVSALGPAPADVVDKARERGMAIGGMTGAGRHAQKHIEAGAEIVIAAGNEGAGHNSDISAMALIPEVVAAAGEVPVLGAGGIVSGGQIAAALAMGAAGVWMGSRWLTTAESDLDEASVERIIQGSSHDTVRTKAWSGKPTRMMRSPWFDAWEREGAPAPLGTPLQRMLIAPSFQRIVAGGRADLMAVPVGQGVGQMTDRQRVRDVMYELQRDYLEAVARLTALQPTA